MPDEMTTVAVVEDGLPIIVQRRRSGIPVGQAGLVAQDVPAVVDRVAAALDFLREQGIGRGPVGAAEVRVRRNEGSGTIAGIEMSVPDSGPTPSVEDDVLAVAGLTREILPPQSMGALPGVLSEAAAAPMRYPTARALSAQILGALAGEPPWASTFGVGGPVQSAKPRSSRRGWVIAGTAVVVVVLLAVVGTVAGVLLTGDSNDDDPGPSQASLPRQDFLVANPAGVKVGQWTAVSVGTLPEDSRPTVCAVADQRVYCRSVSSAITGRHDESGSELVKIDGPKEVKGVSVGGGTVCIVDSSEMETTDPNVGQPACWGMYPEVNRNHGNDGRPDYIRDMPGTTAVSAWGPRACTAMSRALYCFGVQPFTDSSLPGTFVPSTDVGGLGFGDVTDVAVSVDFACAVARQRAYCWGSGDSFKLGRGDDFANDAAHDSDTPIAVGGLGPATKVAVGRGHACAVSAGNVYCWGGNDDNRILGYESLRTRSAKARQVEGLPAGVTAIAASDTHNCAVAGGTAYCWGDNSQGQLGTGSRTPSPTPVQVPGLTQITAISAANGVTCAVNAGNLYCWGRTK